MNKDEEFNSIKEINLKELQNLVSKNSNLANGGDKQSFDYEIELNKHTIKRKNERALSFSIWGLILSFFFGVGAIFSLLGLIFGVKNNKKYSSQTAKWSVICGAIGLTVSLFYIVVGSAILIFDLL